MTDKPMGEELKQMLLDATKFSDGTDMPDDSDPEYRMIVCGDLRKAVELLEAADKLAAALDTALKSIRNIKEESVGVAGLHHNGDIAEWHELERGGEFEEWLSPIDDASDTLAAYQKAKEPK